MPPRGFGLRNKAIGKTVTPAKAQTHVLSEGEAGANYKQNCKCETRNPKFETISNSQKSESSKQARFGFRNWDLSI
jgi:hypothetical protein